MDKVTISRFWHHPEIQTSLSAESIRLVIDLEDYLKALKEEIGSVTWVVRGKTFSDRFDLAAKTVQIKIQQESKKSV